MVRGLLNPSEGARYPNLRQVLQERVRSLDSFPADPAMMTGLVAMTIIVFILIMPIVWLQLAAIPLLAIPAMLWKRLQKNRAPELELRRQNAAVFKRMIQCIEKNRLENDITPSNAQLLEGCAIAYLHARSALDQWQPGYSQEVKRRLDSGVAEAMDEAILAHRDALPDNPTPLPVGVQIGKAADSFLFGKTASVAPLEPAFTRTRLLADQLRDAAHSIEDAARELTGSQPMPIKSASLNDALGDLKMMQQAEEELRQDLHGGA